MTSEPDSPSSEHETTGGTVEQPDWEKVARDRVASDVERQLYELEHTVGGTVSRIRGGDLAEEEKYDCYDGVWQFATHLHHALEDVEWTDDTQRSASLIDTANHLYGLLLTVARLDGDGNCNPQTLEEVRREVEELEDALAEIEQEVKQ